MFKNIQWKFDMLHIPNFRDRTALHPPLQVADSGSIYIECCTCAVSTVWRTRSWSADSVPGAALVGRSPLTSRLQRGVGAPAGSVRSARLTSQGTHVVQCGAQWWRQYDVIGQLLNSFSPVPCAADREQPPVSAGWRVRCGRVITAALQSF